MRLLVITSSYPPFQVGGYEIRCRDVIDGLYQRGHDITVITTKDQKIQDNNEIYGYEVFRTLHKKTESRSILNQIINDRKDIQFLDKYTISYKPEIIYLWNIQNLSNAILPYFSNRNIKIIFDEGRSDLIFLHKIFKRGIYFYKNDNDQIYKKLLKYSIYKFAYIVSGGLINPNWSWPDFMQIYYNSHSARLYSQENGVPIKNTKVIYSGINVNKFPFRPRNTISNPLKIFTPSRISPDKGIKDCIFLARELLNQEINFYMLIIGDAKNEEFFKELIRNIEKYKISKVVTIKSKITQEELSKYYQSYDICFFPSYHKSGFSRVPLEAMSSGCLVITYGNEGSSEIVIHLKTGLVITEGDIVKTARYIETITNNPSFFMNITEEARKSIEQEFILEHYIDQIESLLTNRI